MTISKYFPKLIINQRYKRTIGNSAIFVFAGNESMSGEDVTRFIDPLLSKVKDEDHLYTVFQLSFDSSPRTYPPPPRLVVTDGMDYIWTLKQEKRVDCILKELRIALSPYCRKDPGYNKPVYIVKLPGQEECGIEVESYWTESSDPRYLECRRFTVTVRKNRMITEIETVTPVISSILRRSPNLIACLNMISGEKMTPECIDTDLGDYEITVSPPTSNESNIFVLDFTKEYEQPIKLESNLGLLEILKLISGY